MGIFNSIISFVAGPLNSFAWMYTFLPFAIVGGAYLTIRSGGVQFRHFGHAMKNTVGKMFQKQEAGDGAVTPRQALTTALSATVGTGNMYKFKIILWIAQIIQQLSHSFMVICVFESWS